MLLEYYKWMYARCASNHTIKVRIKMFRAPFVNLNVVEHVVRNIYCQPRTHHIV